MQNSEKAHSSAGKTRRIWIGVAIVVLGLAFYFSGDDDSSLASKNSATFAATRGPLTISVSESGTIKARDQVVLKSQVEGSNTIIFLVEEGSQVKEGDLLVELDASEVELDFIDRKIAAQNADASFVKAREDLAVAESQAKSDISVAELEYRFAKEDLNQYIAGEYPRLRKEAQVKITLAAEEMKNAKETLEWSERLFAEKYISQTELDADRLAENRVRLDHELAVSALKLLEEYTHKRSIDELESGVIQKNMALDRVRRQASASLVQAKAELEAKELESEFQRERLDRLERQITNCKIYAPRDGMVVYATTGESNWRRDEEPLQEGVNVREREELIHLPTTNSMMAEVRVHESSLEKVHAGHPVNITIDALPGRHFTGVVAKISLLPDATSFWLNPDLKVFATEIHLDGDLGEIRTGMSCHAEVIVEEYEDVVFVPVQALVHIGNQPTLFVKTDDDFEARTVEPGLDNNHMVRIVSGLDEGELVLLSPPLEVGATHAASGTQKARPRTPASTTTQTGDKGKPQRRGGGPGSPPASSASDQTKSGRNGGGGRSGTHGSKNQ